MWVRSKYASELAVLSAWLTLFIPWNVGYNERTLPQVDLESSTYFLRFPLFELQLRSGSVQQETAGTVVEFNIADLEAELYPGTNLFGDVFVASPIDSVTFYESTLQLASLAWLFGALAFAGAFALSIALYAREEAVTDALPVSQVRLMGALLGLTAIGTAVATVLYFLERGAVGTPIPVGVLVIGALAAVLLQTEERPDEEVETDADGPSETDEATG